MRMPAAILLLLAPWLSAAGAPPRVENLTVQGALKLLSKEQAKNLVGIEARDGTPAPDRWYFQVYDPSSENGLREIVVWHKTVLVSRTISQFLEGAKPEDVIGAKLVRIDSDELIRIVQQYAEANNLEAVATINYSLFRQEGNPSPFWKLSCFDDSGKKLAEIIINARNASVVSHQGFNLVPGEAAKPAIPVSAAPASSLPTPQPAPLAGAPPVAIAADSPSPSPEAAAAGSSPAPAAVAVDTPGPDSSATPAPASPTPSPSPSPSPTPTPKRGFFQRIFGGGAKSTPASTPRNH